MGSLFSKSTSEKLPGIEGPAPPGAQKFIREEQRVDIAAAESPRFDSNDPDLVRYLDEHGYVVIKAVASLEEVSRATDLLWKFLERDNIGMKRYDPHTWTGKQFQNVGSKSNGILMYNGIQQSDMLWYIRMLPKVKEAFAQVFGTNDLLSSYDGGNIFRPWHAKEAEDYAKTEQGWWHVDQGHSLRGRHAVQGLVTLTNATAQTGGFCVIPGSHKYHDELMDTLNRRSAKNFVFIPPSFHALQERQIMPLCQAGDMVLWDSRTIHCNTSSLVSPTSLSKNKLLRAVGYVCMTPTSKATHEVIEKRRLIFELGDGTTHWPHIIPYEVDATREKVAKFDSLPLEQKKLIVGNENAISCDSAC